MPAAVRRESGNTSRPVARRFADRFVDLAQARSPLCLGLDPSEDLIRHWGLDDSVEGMHRFCQTVLEAAADEIAVVKPQCGFFERLGPGGMDVMAKVIRQAKSQGALALIDCKRGDFARTMTGYAQAMLGDDSGFGGDAMTVTAYLGLDALRPVIDRAAACGAAVFVVVRSSNADGHFLQKAMHDDGRTVAEALADSITVINRETGEGIGHVGAVIGATIDAADSTVLDRLPLSLVLAPGVGAQGATISDVKARFGRAAKRTLPSVSRAILAKGPSVAGLRTAIRRYRDEAWAANSEQ
ncbi:orotidine-5'-phosphate decarboxylase [Mesorhizobium australicum]|uniref:Orotidine-5'-phosphate decarboxylase n=1 Tax=Mesorhizobium australicum TaxID=536018 RepID=A0A1X7PW43_9HYPH|nr:orotidine-5'-phosphate decarboxylase [Mesorhizobium australicum]SMH56482.1 orotidine-5'-phosphate decarboxylase [Mesorhizobium australicum]